MLYLAEVQKQKSGFTTKTTLKLLAFQRGEQSWNAVAGEDVIPAEEASKFNEGSLVLVELNASKQMQRPPQEAARQLVTILQNFSRLQDKFKTQEEEIEQWKQSLTYQSQELNRREMELQAHEEEIGLMQQEVERWEVQRQEIEGAREEATRLQEEVERNRQELESAWQNLNNERQRLEELVQQTSGKKIDEESSRYIKELMEHLCSAIPPTEAVREQLNGCSEKVTGQQSILDQHWQQLQEKQSQAQSLQSEADRLSQDFYNRNRDWQEAHAALDRATLQLRIQQNSLRIKQEYAEALELRLQNHEELRSTVYRFADTSDKVSISQKVDVAALERMPIDDLQGLVQQLQQALDKDIPFVNDQQEELRMQRETLEELQAKLAHANDYERGNLQSELADEQDRYEMLDKTVEGQLRIIRERKEILAQHQAVLSRRLGKPMPTNDNELDFAPILNALDASRQQMVEELQKLEREIDQMRQSIQQAEGMVTQQASEQEAKHQELKQLEEQWHSSRTAAAELWGCVNLYQEMLQPVQDRLNELRQNLEAAAGILNQVQETGDYQLQAIAQMRQFLYSLIDDSSQQLAAS